MVIINPSTSDTSANLVAGLACTEQAGASDSLGWRGQFELDAVRVFE